MEKRKAGGGKSGMMPVAGIDIGGTNTHGVLLRDKRVIATVSLAGNRLSHAIRCYRFLLRAAGGKGIKVVLTGGGSRRIKHADFPQPCSRLDEINAIGNGGVWLAKQRDVFVVSIGTGTAMVSVKAGKSRHVGGTGIGGGTLHGLSTLLLQLPLEKVERIGKGDRNLDLTVRDIVGSGIGKVPGHATASNFGKAKQASSNPSIASSLLRMVAESIGVLAYFAAKTVGQEKRILVCGRVAMNGVVKDQITGTVKMLGGKARIPAKAEFCAAIGAAISLKR